MRAALNFRQQQASETRQRLFAAAVTLFTERGYIETRVDDIARKAGVAKGTFFVHFATKDAVVAALVALQVKAALAAREAAAAGGPLAQLKAAVLALGEQAGVSRGLSRAVLTATLANAATGERADALFNTVLAEMIGDARKAQRAGLLTRDVEAQIIASTLMASYLGAALHFTTSPGARPLPEVLGPLVEANLAGFLRIQSRRRRKKHVR